MIKLKFIPEFFPVLLLPLYWLFLLSFYIFYLPIYFFIWLFSPYKSKKSLKAYYSRKAKKDKRTLEYQSKEDVSDKKDDLDKNVEDDL